MVLNRCSNRTSTMYVRSDRLTQTLAGNPIQLLTVTATGSTEELKYRPMILLMGRVHPGESNSSWIMHGKMKVFAK